MLQKGTSSNTNKEVNNLIRPKISEIPNPKIVSSGSLIFREQRDT